MYDVKNILTSQQISVISQYVTTPVDTLLTADELDEFQELVEDALQLHGLADNDEINEDGLVMESIIDKIVQTLDADEKEDK